MGRAGARRIDVVGFDSREVYSDKRGERVFAATGRGLAHDGGLAGVSDSEDLAQLAKGGRTNVMGFFVRLAGRLPFLIIAGRAYGPEIVGRFALAVLVIEAAALIATLGLKRGLAQALQQTDRPHSHVIADALIGHLPGAISECL